MTIIVDRLDAFFRMRESDGKIFSAEFVKKDGTVRQMTCRVGVHKGVTGVGLRYNPLDKRLLCVYDLQKQGFRMINLQTVRSVAVGGMKLVVR